MQYRNHENVLYYSCLLKVLKWHYICNKSIYYKEPLKYTSEYTEEADFIPKARMMLHKSTHIYEERGLYGNSGLVETSLFKKEKNWLGFCYHLVSDIATIFLPLVSCYCWSLSIIHKELCIFSYEVLGCYIYSFVHSDVLRMILKNNH